MSSDAKDAGPGCGDAIRRQLEHEDGLTINRLSRLAASRSFLFTACAIALNGLPWPATRSSRRGRASCRASCRSSGSPAAG